MLGTHAEIEKFSELLRDMLVGDSITRVLAADDTQNGYVVVTRVGTESYQFLLTRSYHGLTLEDLTSKLHTKEIRV